MFAVGPALAWHLMSQADETSDVDLGFYLRVLRRRKWAVALTAGVFAAAALTFSFLQTSIYRATADVLITSTTSNTSSVFNPLGGAPIDPTRAIETQIQIITSRPIRDMVKASIGKAPSVSVAPLGQTDVVRVAASSTDPVDAAKVANAYVNAYIAFERTQAVNSLLAASDQIQAKINDLQKQIDALNAKLAAAPPKEQATAQANLGPQRDNLVSQQGLFKQRLDQLQVDASVATGKAQLVTPAVPPTSPASPKPVRDGVLALLVGVIVGVGIAFLIDYLDDSVRSRDDVDRASHGLPDLALIPRIPGWRSDDPPFVITVDQPMSPAAEAYRSLRTSIQFAGLDGPARIIEITSPNAEEGKTTTLANLGVVLATAGERVCLCCCDLRRPRIHEFFGMDNQVGLTSVMLGDASTTAAIKPVAGVDGLWLLASGPLPVNPSELLASTRAAEVIRALATTFDIVLLDCPPVLPVTDAAVIAAIADATILVVSIGASARREIGRAAEILTQVNAKVIGTVLNGVSAEGSEGYYQHYHYTRDRNAGTQSVARGRVKGRRFDVHPGRVQALNQP